MNLSVIIYGPQGCGKSRNAKALAELFGLKTICDNWISDNKVQRHGVLYLTNEDPGRHTGAVVIDYKSAIRRIAINDHKIRRPEVVHLAAQLQRQHPDWSEQRALTEAKVCVTAPKGGRS